MPILDTFRRIISMVVIGLLAVIAFLFLVIGLSWPGAVTVIALIVLAINGGWLYLRWSKVVTDVARDQPETTRFKTVGHRVERANE